MKKGKMVSSLPFNRPIRWSAVQMTVISNEPTSVEYRSGNEDCVTRWVRYSCTVIGRHNHHTIWQACRNSRILEFINAARFHFST